ncbi:hypothetical protein HMPREF1549_00714 [Actinomyces johnsonii F0510]|uniref:Uncharacterized protein n=1 Tax=Actinomyces johnsonii F0510 TaxID=1227262 RepID=U1QGD7_9ACTO|nr:hypothetical protein HMPREF1549_00714 [Actinomyces johnsonii F0510]
MLEPARGWNCCGWGTYSCLVSSRQRCSFGRELGGESVVVLEVTVGRWKRPGESPVSMERISSCWRH